MKYRKFLWLVIVNIIIFEFQPINIRAGAYSGFINDAIGPAQASQAETGVPASVSIAQAILESSWGDKHIGSANNYFGIKCQPGQNGTLYFGNIATGCVLTDTQEWDGSKYITVKANFRTYTNMTDSFRDHGHFFLDNPRYSEAMKHTNDPKQFAIEIQKAGYATSPTYATNLISIMDQYNLYQYDKGVTSPSTINTSTVLLFDTSGSMADPDASGVVKLDAAKQAGTKLLDVIGAENGAEASAANKAAIVDFSNNASVDMQPTTDIAATERVLGGLATTGGTAMPKGLKAALDLFPSPTIDKSFIVLLSDGLPNIGLNDEQDEATARQQVLDLATQSGQRGICIYTVGFGDPSSATIDEDLLKQVANNSLCGNYHNAGNAWELANIYINLRHTSTGTTLLSQSGSINQDQLLDVGNVQVPDNQSMILFTLNWSGSQLDAILKDPSGQLVDKNYPGASLTLTDTLASIIIQNPRAGQWNVSARGVNVPEGTTTYNAVLSVRPNLNPPTIGTPQPPTLPSSGGFPFAIITVVLAAFGVVVYTMTLTAKRSARGMMPVHASPASIVALNGTFTGRAIPLRDGMLIGRSSICALRLDDPSVSRRHAQLRYAAGRWYIQDLKSQMGVFVNGARVQAAALHRGDRIRIGSVEFLFN
jgi:uncharacterized protein YegL